MADVYAVFGFLLALALAFPGMLTTVWLLFPTRVDISRQRLTTTPWRCFWLGIIVTFVLGTPIIIMFALPSSPAKIFGGIGLTFVLAFSTLGAAGLTANMADRFRGNANVKPKSVSAFVGSAVALELAAFFPFIGWIVVVPLGILFSLGAATFALFGWASESKRDPQPISDASQISAADIEPQSA